MLKGRLSRDAALVCAAFMDLKMDIDNEAEEIDMCKAIRDFRRECIKEGKKLGIDEGKKIGIDEGKKIGIDEGKKIGIDEGKKIGIAIGEENAIRKVIRNLLSKNFNLHDKCALTDAPEKMVLEEIALAPQH